MAFTKKGEAGEAQTAHVAQLRRQSADRNEGWLRAQSRAGRTELLPAEWKAIEDSGLAPGNFGFKKTTSSDNIGGSMPIANPILNPVEKVDPVGGISMGKKNRIIR